MFFFSCKPNKCMPSIPTLLMCMQIFGTAIFTAYTASGVDMCVYLIFSTAYDHYKWIETSLWDYLPWSVYGKSVKTQRLNISFYLSLWGKPLILTSMMIYWQRFCWKRKTSACRMHQRKEIKYLDLEVEKITVLISTSGRLQVELWAASRLGKLSWFQNIVVINTDEPVLRLNGK